MLNLNTDNVACYSIASQSFYSLFDLSLAGRSRITNKAPTKAMFLKNMILQQPSTIASALLGDVPKAGNHHLAILRRCQHW